MGNAQVTPEKKGIKFGSIKDPNNSRPGYYTNGKIIKYHTDELEMIPGENVESFKKLKYGYATTNKRVFYKGKPVSGIVNPANFRIINRNQISSFGNEQLTKLDSVLGLENVNGDNHIFYKGYLI